MTLPPALSYLSRVDATATYCIRSQFAATQYCVEILSQVDKLLQHLTDGVVAHTQTSSADIALIDEFDKGTPTTADLYRLLVKRYTHRRETIHALARECTDDLRVMRNVFTQTQQARWHAYYCAALHQLQRRRSIRRALPPADACLGCTEPIVQGARLQRQCWSTCTGPTCTCREMLWCADCILRHTFTVTDGGRKQSSTCPSCRGEYCLEDVQLSGI